MDAYSLFISRYERFNKNNRSKIKGKSGHDYIRYFYFKRETDSYRQTDDIDVFKEMSIIDLLGLLLAGFMVSVFVYYNIVTRLDVDIPSYDDVDNDLE